MSLPHSSTFQARVRFLAYHRIKPHVPPLVRAPVNSFEFHRSPGGVLIGFPWLLTSKRQITSTHRLLHGLPGYLILFDTHAFVPQRQKIPSKLPSQSVFCDISKHFTATHHIPPTSSSLKTSSINGSFEVELQNFTADLKARLRTL